MPIDATMAHHRARVAALTQKGRYAEAELDSRDLAARKLLLTARKVRDGSPLPLTDEQVDQIIAVLRG